MSSETSATGAEGNSAFSKLVSTTTGGCANGGTTGAADAWKDSSLIFSSVEEIRAAPIWAPVIAALTSGVEGISSARRRPERARRKQPIHTVVEKDFTSW